MNAAQLFASTPQASTRTTRKSCSIKQRICIDMIVCIIYLGKMQPF